MRCYGSGINNAQLLQLASVQLNDVNVNVNVNQSFLVWLK